MPNAKRKEKLTKTLVEALPPGPKEYTVWDSEIQSFFVRIQPTGTKSFGVFYRNDRGKQRKRSLGSAATVGVAEARKRAMQVLADASRGYDHFEHKDQMRTIPLLEEYWQTYLREHAEPNKSARSVKEDKSLWNNRLRPTFGRRPLDKIAKADVRRWHKSEKKHLIAANRALMLLSTIMNMAINDDLIAQNPCKGLKHFHEEPRDYVPSLSELHLFFKAVQDDHDRGAATMVMLLLLTGARRGEALKAEWKEFDLDRRHWIVPHQNTKSGRRTKKPITRRLSPNAIVLLRQWQQETGKSKGFVFPSPLDSKKPRHDIKAFWNRLRKRSGLLKLRTHDLRHSFASVALEQGFSLAQIGAELGHQSPKTTQRYAHRDLQSVRNPAAGVAEYLAPLIPSDWKDATAEIDRSGGATFPTRRDAD